MLELNGEFYPKSSAIDYELAELHRARGENDKAIARYESVLAKAPDPEVDTDGPTSAPASASTSGVEFLTPSYRRNE